VESQGGLDARTVTAGLSGVLGVYLAKLALELIGSMNKTGRRHGSRTMWQVLATDWLAPRRGPGGSHGAHAERTIAVTADGPRILTSA
jgi:hypothetical protein